MRHYFYLDTRMTRKSGEYPLKLVVNTRGERMYFRTGICMKKEDWDAESETAIGDPSTKRLLNTKIARIRIEIAEFFLSSLSSTAPKTELKRILGCIVDGTDWKANNEPNFLETYKAFADTHQHLPTRKLYYHTINRIAAFDSNFQELTMADITHEWLARFDAFMMKTSPSANARGIHMRNIRAAFNNAIAMGTTEKYPFRRFKIKSQRTRHRALSVEAVRELLAMPLLDHEKQYRDMWMLMFMLCGISPIDLCNLKEVRHGRISCLRSKTAQPIDIRVEPEAMAIIERYHGKSHLLNVLDRCPSGHAEWLRKLNKGLKTLGGVTYTLDTAADGKRRLMSHKEVTWPGLSAYWARHTWASIAASLDIPKETIAQALGHSQHSVTDIYIDFDRTKVDRANRKVLDWVLYSKC